MDGRPAQPVDRLCLLGTHLVRPFRHLQRQELRPTSQPAAHADGGGGGGFDDSQLQCDVAVVGAGLAGLSAAIFLRAHGVDAQLFDRHDSLDGQGVETTVGVLFQEW